MSLDGKKGKKQRHISAQQTDKNLIGLWWKNDDTAQKHYFKSVLELMTPLKEHPNFRIIEVPAGALAYIPHKYYIMDTRDGTPLKGRKVLGQEVEGI